MTLQPKPIALYIHWPFCKAKCPYCDFNSHVRDTIDHAAWKQALLTDMQYWAEKTKGRPLQSIFFGGGTPSLMAPDTVNALITTAQNIWPPLPHCEITLEANPTSFEYEKFTDFYHAGVNRVSLGVQSLRDDALAFLGREHSAQHAIRAIESAAHLFPRYSFDLIYARPQQSHTDWQEELRHALSFAGDHLSLYQLTIEQGTPFYTQHQRGDLVIPDDDAASALYALTQDIMQNAGIPAYEISNHARDGHESQHNLAYWEYRDYIGIGPGAHGRITWDGVKYATRVHRAPEIYLERVKKDGHALQDIKPLQADDCAREMILMGLRLHRGLPLQRITDATGITWHHYIAPQKIERLVAEHYATYTNDTLALTPDGLIRANRVIHWLCEQH